MVGLIGRRLTAAIPVLLVVTFVAFTLLALAPGDPLTARIDRETFLRLTPAEIEALREDFGLNAPVWEQYMVWMGGVVTGDLGYSIVTGRPVIQEVGDRVRPTLLLIGTAIAIAAAVGIPLGVAAANRPHSKLDRSLTVGVVFFVSTPPFIVGLVLIFVLAISFGVLPAGGMRTLGTDPSLADTLRHLAMPAVVLGLANAAPLARFTRSGMLDVLGADFIRTARAKGLSNARILLRHGLANTLLTLITLVAVLLPEMVAGAVITEQVFAWPGMGRLTVAAASARDPAVMMAIVLLVGVSVTVANVLADVLYMLADPRVRIQ